MPLRYVTDELVDTSIETKPFWIAMVPSGFRTIERYIRAIELWDSRISPDWIPQKYLDELPSELREKCER